MTVPLRNVVPRERWLTMEATPKMRSSVLDSCLSSPLTLVVMREGPPPAGGRDYGVAEGREAVEGLGVAELAARVVGELVVPGRHVVGGGIAEDVGHGVGLGDVLGVAADDDGQLALVVERGLGGGVDGDGVVGAGEGVRRLGEDGWVFWYGELWEQRSVTSTEYEKQRGRERGGGEREGWILGKGVYAHSPPWHGSCS